MPVQNRITSVAKILLVEDDIMNAKLFDLILSRKGGHEVITAGNADEAVKYGTSGDMELVIMDVSLQNWVFEGKEVNGIDLTKIIKQDERSKNTPVLLATAHAMKDDKENLLNESGADDYFAKPISDHDMFLSKVETLLTHNKSGTGYGVTSDAGRVSE